MVYMKTIYVGMALTDAPQEFRGEFQVELKAALRNIENVEVLDFIGLENGTEVDVYEYDRKCTEECDVMVAVCDHASLGLGMEIAFRVGVQKPLVLCASEQAKVTRMVTGLAAKEGYSFVRYSSVADIAQAVQIELAKIV